MENKPDYLSKYLFQWDMFQVILGGQSALDASSFLGTIRTKEESAQFLLGYGFDIEDPVTQAELFGNFQEAMQFIKKYFLKESRPDGLDLQIPSIFFTLNHVNDLLILTQKRGSKKIEEERIWAGIILKVMHTIIHADKDLRHNYFPVIQKQIFDRFYKYIFRSHHISVPNETCLFLGKSEHDPEKIPLIDFQTKSKKTRDSIIIKLLHKPENVAEELFDRIGIRFVTFSKLDILRIVSFLEKHSVMIPHNIKPSRSINGLIPLESFKKKYFSILKNTLRTHLNEQEFVAQLENALHNSDHERRHISEEETKNLYSSKGYKAIQFTCRQLIKYRDPFLSNFVHIRKLAKQLNAQGDQSELSKKILELDTSHLYREVRFFYPFEVQLVDKENYVIQTQGIASHEEYKKLQLKAAMIRVFRPLLAFKGIDL
jgi:uncharacterized protein (TIGR04562 family)